MIVGADEPRTTPAASPAPAVSSDLVAARTAVQQIWAAHAVVEGVSWAAAIVRSETASRMLLTSSFGRGWMPPWLLVPADVVSPWHHPDSAAWVGTTDPIRPIAEYAHAEGLQVVAAASTSTVDAWRGVIPELEVVTGAGGVAALRPGSDVVDRAQLALPPDQIDALTRVDVPEARRHAFALAWDVVTSLPHSSARAMLACRDARDEILTTIRDVPGALDDLGGCVPLALWQALASADHRLAGIEIGRRVDTAGTALGDLETPGSTRRILATQAANAAVAAVAADDPRVAVSTALYWHHEASRLIASSSLAQ